MLDFVHLCRAGGRMRACHAAGPGWIPGRDNFLGEHIQVFSSLIRQMSGSFRPPWFPEYHLAIMYVCKVICPKVGLSLDMHYQGSAYVYWTKERSEAVCQVLSSLSQ